MKETFREERDSLGPVQVPGERVGGEMPRQHWRTIKEMIRLTPCRKARHRQRTLRALEPEANDREMR